MNSFQQKIFNEFVSNNKLSAGEQTSLKKYIEMYGFDDGLERFKRRLQTMRKEHAANVSASTKSSATAAAQAAAKAASAAGQAAQVQALKVSASRQAASASASKAAAKAAQAAQSLQKVADTADQREKDHAAYLEQAARREVLRNKQQGYNYQAEGQAAEQARQEAAEQARQEAAEDQAVQDLLTATAASEQALIDDAAATVQEMAVTTTETTGTVDTKKAFIICAGIGLAWYLWRRHKKKKGR